MPNSPLGATFRKIKDESKDKVNKGYFRESCINIYGVESWNRLEV